MTEAEQIMKRCQAGTRNYEEANNLHAACYGIIGRLLAQEPPKYSFKTHWEKDGRIGVVGAVVRPDGGVHVLQDIIDPPQPEQEPVAWELGVVNGVVTRRPIAPPQRTWVGLEGEEIRNSWEQATKPDRSTMTMVTSFARAMEAKLKEKNT